MAPLHTRMKCRNPSMAGLNALLAMRDPHAEVESGWLESLGEDAEGIVDLSRELGL